MKSRCCKRFKKKGKPCKGCPTLARLSEKKAKAFLRKIKAS